MPNGDCSTMPHERIQRSKIKTNISLKCRFIVTMAPKKYPHNSTTHCRIERHIVVAQTLCIHQASWLRKADVILSYPSKHRTAEGHVPSVYVYSIFTLAFKQKKYLYVVGMLFDMHRNRLENLMIQYTKLQIVDLSLSSFP